MLHTFSSLLDSHVFLKEFSLFRGCVSSQSSRIFVYRRAGKRWSNGHHTTRGPAERLILWVFYGLRSWRLEPLLWGNHLTSDDGTIIQKLICPVFKIVILLCRDVQGRRGGWSEPRGGRAWSIERLRKTTALVVDSIGRISNEWTALWN
jgi:hypothetical protein